MTIKKTAFTHKLSCVLLLALTSNTSLSVTEDQINTLQYETLGFQKRYYQSQINEQKNSPMNKLGDAFDTLNPDQKFEILDGFAENFGRTIGDGLSKAAEDAISQIGNSLAGMTDKAGDTLRTYGTDKIAKYGVMAAGGITTITVTGHFLKKWWDKQIKVWYKPTLQAEKGKGKNKKHTLQVILNEEAKDALNEALSTLTNQNIDTELPNLLFYGPPGTGKTLQARHIADEYDFDFILLTGSSWFSLPMNIAIEEMDKLFNTLEKTKKRTMVFIDEADSLVVHRDLLKFEDTKIVTHFLSKTGELSNKHFFVFATNRRDKFDPAVEDRITYEIRFDLPDQKTRQKLLKQYLHQSVDSISKLDNPKIIKEWINHNLLSWSVDTEGFSGRGIKNAATRLKWKLLTKNTFYVDNELTPFMEKTFTDIRLKKQKKDNGLL